MRTRTARVTRVLRNGTRRAARSVWGGVRQRVPPAARGDLHGVFPEAHGRRASDEVREAADEILRQVGGGIFRYAAEGPFIRAVEEPREPARWGDGDAARRILRAALPE